MAALYFASYKSNGSEPYGYVLIDSRRAGYELVELRTYRPTSENLPSRGLISSNAVGCPSTYPITL